MTGVEEQAEGTNKTTTWREGVEEEIGEEKSSTMQRAVSRCLLSCLILSISTSKQLPLRHGATTRKKNREAEGCSIRVAAEHLDKIGHAYTKTQDELQWYELWNKTIEYDCPTTTNEIKALGPPTHKEVILGNSS